MSAEDHLLFFKPAGFASKRACTKAPMFSFKLFSAKLTCKMTVRDKDKN